MGNQDSHLKHFQSKKIRQKTFYSLLYNFANQVKKLFKSFLLVTIQIFRYNKIYTQLYLSYIRVNIFTPNLFLSRFYFFTFFVYLFFPIYSKTSDHTLDIAHMVQEKRSKLTPTYSHFPPVRQKRENNKNNKLSLLFTPSVF